MVWFTTATVHMADPLGRIDILPVMWIIGESGTQEPLMGRQVTFTVPSLAPGAYDGNGKAPMLGSVAVAKRADFLENITLADFIAWPITENCFQMCCGYSCVS